MDVSCSNSKRERILNRADKILARMIRVPCRTDVFIDVEFVANIIFYNQIVTINLQSSILIRARLYR